MEAGAALERGREAYAQRAWDRAYAWLSEADRDGLLGPGDLQQLALAGELTGHEGVFFDALDRAHRLHIEAGDGPAAARCAFWVGLRMLSLGEVGQGSGWLQRARRLVERAGRDCVERGYLLLAETQQRLAAGDLEAAYASASGAEEAAERFEDAELHAFAVHAQGIVRLRQARLAEGLALIDEAMVALSSREMMPILTGIIYCSVISACHSVYALRRASEWTRALAAWCDPQPGLVPFAGRCLVFRSEVLQLRGSWGEALAEARDAEQRCLRSSEREGVAEARYQQGEVQRLQGAFDDAEESYRQAAHLGRDPQPGLALLRLAKGKREAAVNALRRALEESRERTRRVRVLPALVEALLVEGDVGAAQAACEELESIAGAFEGGALDTVAAQWRGAVDLAAGDAAAALTSLRRAWRGWQALEAPYEAARTRELVARACRALGDDETAALELEAVRETYRRLGAAPDLARLERLPRDDGGLSARELEVLRLVSQGRTNKAIAGELGLSERTIERHVSNIFDKLQVASRSAATAYAYEHGLA